MSALDDVLNFPATFEDNHEDRCMFCEGYINTAGHKADCPKILALSEWEQIKNFHPRAMKLIGKKKNFLVVAEDEPYFMEVYAKIRETEKIRWTWSEEDERLYEIASSAPRPPSRR